LMLSAAKAGQSVEVEMIAASSAARHAARRRSLAWLADVIEPPSGPVILFAQSDPRPVADHSTTIRAESQCSEARIA
jgi:hypothetical protein